MVKLLENTFRAVNIGLVNELALMCDKLGIDVWEVIDAAKTKPFGFMPFYPGPGLGGHCIPIDPFYLSWKAQQTRVRARASSSWPARSTPPCRTTSWTRSPTRSTTRRKALNGSQGAVARHRVQEGHRRHARVAGARRHGTAPREKGAVVSYAIPFVPELHGRELVRALRPESGRPDTRFARPYDCVVILTDHRVRLRGDRR